MTNFTRRALLAGLAMMAPSFARGKFFMSNNLDIELSITDEQGKAIPYATLWGYVLPRANPLALDDEDLWRLTTRYAGSFEFATPFNPIVQTLQVLPMGDVDGHAKAVIEYHRLEGSDKRRPASMRVGFTAMKQGYLPARIDFVAQDNSHLNGVLRLKRDPGQSLETQPYLLEYQRIRCLLSDTGRNEIASVSAHEHINALRNSLETAINEALHNSDKPAAARIHARMQYLPEIVLRDGAVVGFSQAEPYSARSWSHIVKAYQLDPNNPYIAAEYLYRLGAEKFGGNKFSSEHASSEMKREFSNYLSTLQALMRTSGSKIWPEYHMLYALWHRKSLNPNDRQQVLPLLEELYRFEPKFQTRARLLQMPPA